MGSGQSVLDEPGSLLLIVSPDYASHLNPLLPIGHEWMRRGGRTVVATGHAVQPRVLESGLEHRRLRLGADNNGGVQDSSERHEAEVRHMADFHSATRGGMARTVEYQSRARKHDMLFDPPGVYRRINSLLHELQPARILVDQLAFPATLALHALGVPFSSFQPANPAGMLIDGHLFGLPRFLPSCIEVSAEDWDRAESAALSATTDFTVAFNKHLFDLSPAAPAVEDAFAFTSAELVLINYPAELLAPGSRLPPQAQLIGSSIREERHSREFETLLARLDHRLPTVYVSLGTFLSARSDVFDAIVAAVRPLPVNVILACGVTAAGRWGELPANWVVQPFVPQLAALGVSSLVLSHGGNNTVTEALTMGVPLLLGPFSSDQFDSAADVERSGLGHCFDPNRIDPRTIRNQVAHMLGDAALRARVAALSRRLHRDPGPRNAVDLVAAGLVHSRGSDRRIASDGVMGSLAS